ncbi:hypothetical protein [Streptomyces sp. NPDC058694]|uniref:hypothetical protein n=1 Tax=Streptomyces sp. NPDC058694 TaxID=3346603 RepID=UPI0036510167
MTSAPRVSRKGLLAAVAAFMVLLSALSISAPPAGAAESRRWPELSQYWPDGRNGGPREYAFHDVSTDTRNYHLNHCPRGYLCVAAGEGDGQHTVFILYYCTSRSLYYFHDRGAVTNNQYGSWASVMYQDHSPYTLIEPNNRSVSIPWDPIYYLDPCI